MRVLKIFKHGGYWLSRLTRSGGWQVEEGHYATAPEQVLNDKIAWAKSQGIEVVDLRELAR